jgi:hypothetical protein
MAMRTPISRRRWSAMYESNPYVPIVASSSAVAETGLRGL